MTRRMTITYDEWGSVKVSYNDIVGTFGEILAEAHEKGYQGDSLWLIHSGGRYGILTFGWGSCSGCDALEACRTQKDFDELQDELERGIRWHDSLEGAIADLDGQWIEDSWLDSRLVREFRKRVEAFS